MRLLLDSHVALWWLADDPALGPRCRRSLDEADEIFYSSVTPWELGIKQAAGKLSMPDDLVGALGAAGFEAMAISPVHAALAPTLPDHHRDPFDRMLVAQARLESLVLVSADAVMGAYDVELVDARR